MNFKDTEIIDNIVDQENAKIGIATEIEDDEDYQK